MLMVQPTEKIQRRIEKASLHIVLPSLKLTISPLKMDDCDTNFLLGFGLFSGANR